MEIGDFNHRVISSQSLYTLFSDFAIENKKEDCIFLSFCAKKQPPKIGSCKSKRIVEVAEKIDAAFFIWIV